jgi:hypothetical protein
MGASNMVFEDLFGITSLIQPWETGVFHSGLQGTEVVPFGVVLFVTEKVVIFITVF